MITSVWLHSALASSIVLTLACSESSGPVEEPSTFILRQVQQDPLPTVLAQTETFVIRVMSDTIRLAEDGTGSNGGVRESVPLQGGSGEGPVHIANDLHYRLTGNRIEIDFDCPPGADCIPPPHLIADRQGNQLVVTWGPYLSGRSPLIYEKTGP